jgi:hypothetical protein
VPPQKISNRRYPQDADVSISPEALSQRPQFAADVLTILTRWPFVEATLGGLFISILGDDAEKHIDRFIERANTRRYREMVLEAAKQQLSGEVLEFLEVIMWMYIDVFERRNIFAHWVTGISTKIPESILFQNPHDHWRFLVSISRFGRNVRQGSPNKVPLPEINRHRIIVYERKHFDDLTADLEAVDFAMGCLHTLCDPRSVNTNARDRLFALPQFQRARGLRDARASPKPPKSLLRRLARLRRQLSLAFREFFQAR